MGAEHPLPVDTQVVVEGGLLAELGAHHALDLAKTFNALGGGSVVGKVVLLVDAVQNVAETVANAQITVDLVFGGHIDGELGLLQEVLIVTLAVLKDPVGIDKAGIAEGLGKAVGVVGVRIVLAGINLVGMLNGETAVIEDVMGVRTDERGLDQTKDIRGGDVAGGIVLGPAVVAKVIGIARIGKVQACGKVLEHVDVRVETDVQTVEVGALGGGVGLGIAQREVVHGNIVATFNADLVVLGEGGLVKAFLPVGLIVVYRIEQIVGVLVHERGDGAGTVLEVVAGGGGCAKELGDVVAVLAGVHHVCSAGGQLEAAEGADIDTGDHAAAALGGDLDHTVAATGTVEGRTVLEETDILDVLGVEDVEDVVDKAFMEG